MTQAQEPMEASARPGMPRHVAVIMDGNGRWAQKRALPRSAGHWQGVEAVRRTVRAAADMGIEYLTLYSFSSENWTRPATEVDYLLNLLRRFIHTDVEELNASGVRIRIIGERDDLQPDLRELIEHSERLTENNARLNLVVAFNYGSRDEIARAARRLARAIAADELEVDDVTPDTFASFLDTDGIPDPDLIIRTSGEQRLSNFLMWQSAYAEFVFVDEYWPDFDREIFERALDQYLNRDRRYGGVTASGRAGGPATCSCVRRPRPCSCPLCCLPVGRGARGSRPWRFSAGS
jgi:undecaprenyl diphosphate synthase